MLMRAASLALALCLAGAFDSPARAQVALPGLPDLSGVTQPLHDLSDQALGVADLEQVRLQRVRDLLRRHRDVLERDPAGNPIVRRRILAVAPSPAALEAAREAGFEVESREELEGVGALVTLIAPRGLSTRRALRRLREADPEGVYDYDHLHLESGVGAVGAAQTLAASTPGAGRMRIGLIDGGVGASPAVSGAIGAQRSFAAPEPVASAHATLIAGLLAAEEGQGARILAADIFGDQPTGGAASVLARAFAWLASERTPVINVSLVGPRNRVVETVVASLVARGFVIVAAVGNDGPAAAPLYPAAYPGVIGVTGVDARERVLVEAGRGPQVDFAALGIVEAGRTSVRGTSYAAPIVARQFAREVAEPSPANAEAALTRLRGRAHDLGAPGRDNTYGEGLLGHSQRAQAAR